ncbi:MAG: cyclic nucleotide-binding domain-containing protein [Proteobacteria bacterium]|nr:cyclic nucleotide-binding domain-containing protein [Pseudomonadota bacterium]MBU1715589.1 cyclic nucleotide-binding domain-containing protein [Pseudomonadota bacterium]
MVERQDLMDVEKFLSSVEVFSALDHDNLLMISRYVEIEHYAGNEVIIEQGRQGKYLWMIYQGSVNVFQEAEGKGKKLIAILSPPDIFGEISLISKSTTTAEVRAEGSCIFLRVPQEIVLFVMNKNLTTNSYFSRTFVKRIADSANKMIRKD